MNENETIDGDEGAVYESMAPGAYLQEKFMGPMSISEDDIAKGSGLSVEDVRGIVGGTVEISPMISARLGRYFGVPEEWWYGVQSEHLFHVLRAEHPELFVGDAA